MNEFDQFVKHELKIKNYVRYTDDFVIVSENKNYLESLLPKLQAFLLEDLKLELHPKKTTITNYNQGIDFLGYVIFPYHRLIRAKTKKRIERNMSKKIQEYRGGVISEDKLKSSLQSYLGVMSHADAHEFTESFINKFWFELNN